MSSPRRRQERWAEAALKLQRVRDGATGDDATASSPSPTSRVRSSTWVSSAAAILWVAKLAEEPLSSDRAFDLLYLYTDQELVELDNPAQRDALASASWSTRSLTRW